MRRRRELGAGGASPCRKVEALGVEPDRPPPPGAWSPGGGLVPREPREPGLAECVHLRDKPVFGRDQRRFALTWREDLSDCERGGATEAAICRNLKDLVAQTGLTILAISHQSAWVEAAHHVYHVERGQVGEVPRIAAS